MLSAEEPVNNEILSDDINELTAITKRVSNKQPSQLGNRNRVYLMNRKLMVWDRRIQQIEGTIAGLEKGGKNASFYGPRRDIF